MNVPRLVAVTLQCSTYTTMTNHEPPISMEVQVFWLAVHIAPEPPRRSLRQV